MFSKFIEQRKWLLFRSLVRTFMKQFAFNRMITIIAEEQRREYYEDNVYTRKAQFEDAFYAVPEFALFVMKTNRCLHQSAPGPCSVCGDMG
jgi:hypothetical protein